MCKGYATCSKTKSNTPLCSTYENNLLPVQSITSTSNKEELAGAAAEMGLLSPPTDNSTNQNLSQSSVKMKCIYQFTQHHFFNYFNDPILDDAVIYTGNIPFQYNKIEGQAY